MNFNAAQAAVIDLCTGGLPQANYFPVLAFLVKPVTFPIQAIKASGFSSAP
jgi:hypothetical protein